MQPPGEDTRRGTDPRPGVVVIGAYALEIGRPAGTVISPSPDADQAEADSLAQALREQGPPPEPEKTAVEAASDAVDDASAATAKVERAVSIGKGMAAGNALDPAQLGLEVDAMLDLLERLDREGRAKEALRLARALSKLYALLRRWMELLRALQAALRAGEKLGDLKAIGWAKHELGTLQLAGGDVEGAERTLGEAREIRRRLGDRDELAATEHNLHACSRQAHGGAPPGPPRSLSLTPALAIGAVVLVIGLAAGSVLGDSGGETTTITGTATETSEGNGDKTVTTTVVSTVTETVKEVVKPSGETETETETGAGERGETETLRSGETETGEPETLEEGEAGP